MKLGVTGFEITDLFERGRDEYRSISVGNQKHYNSEGPEMSQS